MTIAVPPSHRHNPPTMKFLLDLLPVVVFFAGYASGHTLPALGLNKPIEFATSLAIVVSVLQMGWMLVRRHPIQVLQWISFGLIVVMGGATLLFHNPVFIYVKPTALWCAMAIAMLVSRFGMNVLPLKALMGKELTLPDVVWDKMMWAWIAFLVAQAVANLYVAFSYPEAVWVKYKLIASIAGPLVFIIGQSIWLARHLPATKSPKEGA